MLQLSQAQMSQLTATMATYFEVQAYVERATYNLLKEKGIAPGQVDLDKLTEIMRTEGEALWGGISLEMRQALTYAPAPVRKLWVTRASQRPARRSVHKYEILQHRLS